MKLGRNIAEFAVQRVTKDSDYKKALRTNKVDGLIQSSFDTFYQITDQTKLIDSVGLLQTTRISAIKFTLDSIFNSKAKNPLIAVLIPCYDVPEALDDSSNQQASELIKKDGFAFDQKQILWDSDKGSSIDLYKFEGETTILVEGGYSLAQLEFILVLYLEAVKSEDDIKLKQYGFTLIPNKTLDYFLHGPFQLPIFKEKLKEEDLEQMESESFWELHLMSEQQHKSGELRLLEASSIVRIVLKEFDDMYLEADDTLLMNSMLMPATVDEKLLLTSKRLEKARNSEPKVAEIMPQEFVAGQQLVEKVEEYLKKRFTKQYMADQVLEGSSSAAVSRKDDRSQTVNSSNKNVSRKESPAASIQPQV